MTTETLDLTRERKAAWVRQRWTFGVDVRRPEIDETPLSDAEVLHGVRRGVFDGYDGEEPIYILEKR